MDILSLIRTMLSTYPSEQIIGQQGCTDNMVQLFVYVHLESSSLVNCDSGGWSDSHHRDNGHVRMNLVTTRGGCHSQFVYMQPATVDTRLAQIGKKQESVDTCHNFFEYQFSPQ